MAKASSSPGFSEFLAGMQSGDALRTQLGASSVPGVQQSAMDSIGEHLSLMAMLPGAFAASQKRELDRLSRTADERDPRVLALKLSIAQVDALRATAHLGQTRVQRSFAALIGGANVFMGFVSDVNLRPLEGLTVRLIDEKASTGHKTLAGTTDSDGHFSIDLGDDASSLRSSGTAASQPNLMQRLAGLFADSGAASTASSAQSAKSTGASAAQVEILQKGKVLYRDPIPLTIQSGSVYREYMIPDAEPTKSVPVHQVVAERPSAAPSAKTQAQRAAKTVQPKKRK
jgi:hypothetical protein